MSADRIRALLTEAMTEAVAQQDETAARMIGEAVQAYDQERTPSGEASPREGDTQDTPPVIREIAKAMQETRHHVAETALRGVLLEDARADRKLDDESVYDAATAYRRAEEEMNKAIQREIELYKMAYRGGQG